MEALISNLFNDTNSIFSLYWLEWIITVPVISFQVYFFVITIKGIQNFKTIFPSRKHYKFVEKVLHQNRQDAICGAATEDDPKKPNRKGTEEPSENTKLYRTYPKERCGEEEAQARINRESSESIRERQRKIEIQVNVSTKENPKFKEICTTINEYLAKVGRMADFSVIKDVVTRECESIDKSVDLTMPLYLGFIGTILGIAARSLSVPLGFSSENATASNSIESVAIAMLSSLCGLIYIVIASSFYKKAKRGHESGKAQFFYAVQTELLPILPQGIACSISSLERSMSTFSDHFSDNIHSLSNAVESAFRIIQKKDSVQPKIEALDNSKIVSDNFILLKEFQKGAESFSQFAKYLERVNIFIENSDLLVHKVNDLLERTESFKTLAMAIKSKLDQAERLTEFLNSHFSILEERKTLIKKVSEKIDSQLEKRFHIFYESTEEVSNRMKNTFADMDARMKEGLKIFDSNIQEYDRRAFNTLTNIHDKLEKSLLYMDQISSKQVASIDLITNQGQTSLKQIINESQTSIQSTLETFRNTLLQNSDRLYADLAKNIRDNSEQLFKFNKLNKLEDIEQHLKVIAENIATSSNESKPILNKEKKSILNSL